VLLGVVPLVKPWVCASVAVSGTFMGGGMGVGRAYVKTPAGHVSFSQPADLRGQLPDVAPGTAITI
jgi:hypothetical protein